MMSKKSKYLPENKEYFILVTLLIVIFVSLGASFIHFYIHLEDNIEIIKSLYKPNFISLNFSCFK